MLHLDASDKFAIRAVIMGLEVGWNKGSASEFVKSFALNADFMTVYGGRGSGRKVILGAFDRIPFFSLHEGR